MFLFGLGLGMLIGLTITCIASCKNENLYQQKITELKKENKYWEFEAKKWADKLYDIRLYAILKECERCPKEDTDLCYECER